VTLKTDFTTEEWTLLRTAPVLAGLRVAVADHGADIEEIAAIARAYADAHERLWPHPGEGGVVDAIIADGPVYDSARFGKPPDDLDADRIIEESTQTLREAIALLRRKATPAEQMAYREFVLDLARRVAEAHRESGVFDLHTNPISERERAALAELEALFPPSSPAHKPTAATVKADFTPGEWTVLRTAPVLAGLRVAVADHGGNVDELAAIAEAYGEAHEQWWAHPGTGGVVDQIIAEGPAYDRNRFGEPPYQLAADRIVEETTRTLREAITLLERKATPPELAAYRKFVLNLARRVAQAHQEPETPAHDGPISDREQAALAELEMLFPADAREPAFQP
jgi:hypothetical protein